MFVFQVMEIRQRFVHYQIKLYQKMIQLQIKSGQNSTPCFKDVTTSTFEPQQSHSYINKPSIKSDKFGSFKNETIKMIAKKILEENGIGIEDIYLQNLWFNIIIFSICVVALVYLFISIQLKTKQSIYFQIFIIYNLQMYKQIFQFKLIYIKFYLQTNQKSYNIINQVTQNIDSYFHHSSYFMYLIRIPLFLSHERGGYKYNLVYQNRILQKILIKKQVIY
ncbi:unnamed protein product [Paramecium sonneborni]|uniref:Transmembrane protein n=1 Tax=Paramecium sonneborni TaxID=65129 RepID=A0A8S1PVK9_9CILI|nr:unnamed protein product [Paramecium sonneborni]